jgi:hypothetical protein
MERDLGDLAVDLKLAILLSHLGIAALGHPPLPEVMAGVITIVGVEGVRR